MNQSARPTLQVISSPEQLPPLARRLGDFFASQKLTAYLVGGAVRDALLDRPTVDIDVAVKGVTAELGPKLAGVVGGRSFVVDSTRDLSRVVLPTERGGEVIDLSPLKGDILDDLGRRDFTADAMAVGLSEGESQADGLRLLDPFDGLNDLRHGVIRAVSSSVFVEDGARLLRGPRLAAQLRFRLDDDTAESIRGHADLVSNVAPERVRDEFLKLLSEPNSQASLRGLDDLGLLCRIMPELVESKGSVQPKEHYWDVFGHSIETTGQVERVLAQTLLEGDYYAEMVPRFETMEQYFQQDVSDGHSRVCLLKLAALLHDVAKPATKTVEETGRIRFLGHHTVGAETAGRILSRLRVSRKGTELVSTAVEFHLRPGQLSQDGELPSQKALYRYFRDVGDAAIDTLYLNLADYLAARGPLIQQQEWRERCSMIGHILQAAQGPKQVARPERLIDGHEVMKTFSLAPGPRIGELLELVQEAHGSGEIHTRDEAVELIRSTLVSGGSSA